MLKLFTPIISALVSSEVQAVTQRAKRSAIFYGIIVFVGVIGLFFALIATYLALATRFGLINSALLITATCAIIAVIAYTINRVLDNAERRRLEQRRAAIDTNAALTAAAVAAVPSLLKRPLLTVALPVVGLIAFSLLSKDKKSISRKRTD